MKLGIRKRDNQNGSDLATFRRSISDLFDDFFILKPTGFFDSEWIPAVDMHEDKKNIYVKADIPGIDVKNLEVNIENNILHIKGENTEEKHSNERKSVVIERKHGVFQRSIRLPEGIKSDSIKAEFKNGVLNLEIPKEKVEEQKKIKINIQ
jgi:HSP20 family protein